jgi:transposase-like protein
MDRPGRRRWTAEQKLQIVEETRAPGASVSVVARRYDINANLLFKWKPCGTAGEPVSARNSWTRLKRSCRNTS